MKTVVVTSATGEPISRKQAKEHLRLSTAYTDDDSYIDAIITASRLRVENNTNRKLMYQKHKVFFDDFPTKDYIEIPYAPLKSIPSSGLRYTNSTGLTQTFSSTKYSADIYSEPGRLVLKYNDDWPSDTLATNNPISVEFVCGYSSSPSSSGGRFVPETLKHAMRLIIGDLYQHREESTLLEQGGKFISGAVQLLLSPYRIFKF